MQKWAKELVHLFHKYFLSTYSAKQPSWGSPELSHVRTATKPPTTWVAVSPACGLSCVRITSHFPSFFICSLAKIHTVAVISVFSEVDTITFAVKVKCTCCMFCFLSRGPSVKAFWWRKPVLCCVVPYVAMCAVLLSLRLPRTEVWVISPRQVCPVRSPQHQHCPKPWRMSTLTSSMTHPSYTGLYFFTRFRASEISGAQFPWKSVGDCIFSMNPSSSQIASLVHSLKMPLAKSPMNRCRKILGN